MLDMSIKQLHSILNQEVLPDKWSMDIMMFPDNDSYVKETYQGVSQNYNGIKPLHELAICVAIMFCQLLPNIMHGTKPSSLIGSSSQINMTLIVHNIPWDVPCAAREACHKRTYSSS
jgi:hypothetical protein